MSDIPRKTKANGHIVQADWNQTDPLKMDYIHNKPEIPTVPSIDHLASIDYVDHKQIKIVNRSGKVYTSQIKIGDLEWNEDLGAGGGLGFAPVVLPAETSNTTEYTIRMLNPPTTNEIQQAQAKYGFWYLGYPAAAFAIIHNLDILAQEILIEQNIINPSESDLENAKLQALFRCDNYNNYYNTGGWQVQTEYAKALNISGTQIDQITFTGPWYVYCGESSGSDIALQWHAFENSIIEYSYERVESDEEALGPVHNIDLHSNTEVHYDFPVTELTINTLHKCFSDNINQQWVVSFIAGDIDPIVIVPESVNNKPVKWINGKPQFRSNKKYMLTFKEITDTFYIETKLLSEDKICDQWILCPVDQESEGATYGDFVLTSVSLHDIVLNLKENEIFEIMGGKTVFVITQSAHPDYEASQGGITISGAPDAYINNCISLKIWKIRSADNTSELEVHILGSFIPNNGDNLPGTAACTDSTFYLILSDYISKCITGGGIQGHSLIKYSNIL